MELNQCMQHYRKEQTISQDLDTKNLDFRQKKEAPRPFTVGELLKKLIPYRPADYQPV